MALSGNGFFVVQGELTARPRIHTRGRLYREQSRENSRPPMAKAVMGYPAVNGVDLDHRNVSHASTDRRRFRNSGDRDVDVPVDDQPEFDGGDRQRPSRAPPLSMIRSAPRMS